MVKTTKLLLIVIISFSLVNDCISAKSKKRGIAPTLRLVPGGIVSQANKRERRSKKYSKEEVYTSMSRCNPVCCFTLFAVTGLLGLGMHNACKPIKQYVIPK